MLKRILELLVVAIVGYAGWHAGAAYFNYYQFRDGITQLALFAGNTTEDQLKARVVDLAQQYEIPLEDAAITVHTDAEVTQITAPYTARVKLLPNYVYEWKFEPKASVVHVR